jgi:shikimate kinase
VLFKRIIKRKTRPLLLDEYGDMKDLDRLYLELNELFKKRSTLYEQADYIYSPVANQSKEQNAIDLARIISNS